MTKRISVLQILALVTCASLLAISGSVALASVESAAKASQSVALDPGVFADLSSGIALVRTFGCGGAAKGEGTGFLVGSGVVMTARHVIRGACRVRVLIGGKWMSTNGWTSWYTKGRGDLNTADVATIRLHGQSDGHVFTIRSWSAAIGANVAALGHPLGTGISLTQGKVVEKGKLYGVPTLAVRLLAAEGGSGSPLVDNKGNVVGILQIGLGGADVLGQRTSGVILGIDMPSWWPGARSNLCRAYPQGGVAGCKPVSPPPEQTPPPTCDLTPGGSCAGFDLSGRNMSGMDLDGIDFSGSDLSRTDLSNSDLSSAILEQTDLTSAILSGANLSLADLSGALLDFSQLHDALLCQTLLPDGVSHSGCGLGAVGR